ncbi:MAG: hypothetical protein NVSMB56_03060 [Pyrinomonadaceae bacterium]
MTSLDAALAALHIHFGFADFRDAQRDVIASILEGHDTVVVMPTGGGKSLCYQLPALMQDGATVVVSPLIALMKDQVDALHARDLPATFSNSSIDFEDQKKRLSAVRQGKCKLIYVAPERFRSAHFVNTLRETGVQLFAVDEAHCISQWGHDFRPDYLRLREAIEALGRPQVIALTATATPYVRADIIEQLALDKPRAFVSGFDRPNLTINVIHTEKETQKIAHIRRLAAQYKNQSGIIYTSTRKSVEKTFSRLKQAGLNVVAYHAGMSEGERTKAQDDFMSGRAQMIVATNAFGMGIDKPDIRFVAHYHLPGSIEAYYQEIGRAGRDGLPATCVLLFNYADKRTQDFFIEGSHPPPDMIARVYQTLTAISKQIDTSRIALTTREIAARASIKNEMAVQSALVILEKAGHLARGVSNEERADNNRLNRTITLLDETPATSLRIRTPELARRAALEQRKLREMISFCYTEDCFRAFILKYFGERQHAQNCGTCGNCQTHENDSDANTTDELNAASHQTPAQKSSHAPLAPESKLDRFIKTQTPFAYDLDTELNANTQRQRARHEAEQRAHEFSDDLSFDDAINVTEPRELNEDEKLRGRKILACAARMEGRFGKAMLAATLRGSRSAKITQANLDKLSTYGILSDMTQDEIIPYIDALINAGCLRATGGTYPTIFNTAHGNDVMRERAEIKLALPDVLSVTSHPKNNQTSNVKTYSETNTIDATFALYEQDLTIEDIAAERNLTTQTIEKHLADGFAQGREFDVSRYVTDADRALIEQVIRQHGAERLKPLRDALPSSITYRMIRFIVADVVRRQENAARS